MGTWSSPLALQRSLRVAVALSYHSSRQGSGENRVVEQQGTGPAALSPLCPAHPSPRAEQGVCRGGRRCGGDRSAEPGRQASGSSIPISLLEHVPMVALAESAGVWALAQEHLTVPSSRASTPG
jgi:hypothetical protein